MDLIIDENKILKFNYGNTGDVLELIRFISKKAKNNIKDFDFSKIDINKLDNIDISAFLTLICDCIGDKELENIFFKLSSKCIFENEKITQEFFDDIKNRKYFIKIFVNIIKENLKVFFTIPATID